MSTRKTIKGEKTEYLGGGVGRATLEWEIRAGLLEEVALEQTRRGEGKTHRDLQQPGEQLIQKP